MEKDTCQSKCHHPDIIASISGKLESLEHINSLAELFKVLGDPTRIKILNALIHEPLCVCDIADIMNMGSSAISHQLRVLRAAKLVKFKRDGKNVIYSLDDDHVEILIKSGLEHILE